MKKLQVTLWLLSVVALASLAGCGGDRDRDLFEPTPTLSAGEIDLPFETIEKEAWGGADEVLEPRLIMINTKEEIGQLDEWVTPAALEQLAALAFEQFFAVAIFRGTKGTSGYETRIDRVTLQDGKVVVHIQFWAPDRTREIQPSETSPYHVVKVRREAGVGQRPEIIMRSRTFSTSPVNPTR